MIQRPSSPSRCLIAATFAGCLMLAACGRGHEIAGAIDTTDFVIPSGEVVTATGDLTITASRKIEIDGTLYVVPGANVTFQSPDVSVTGSVQNLATRVGWWRRAGLVAKITTREIGYQLDRMLGRTPNYWAARGTLDCSIPQGRFDTGASAPPRVAQSAP
jgi:hypothetical protein